MGQLLGPKLPRFINEVYSYTEQQVVAGAANGATTKAFGRRLVYVCTAVHIKNHGWSTRSGA